MKNIVNIVVMVLLVAVGWYAWGKFEEKAQAERAAAKRVVVPLPSSAKAGGRDPLFFACDGRNLCSQMTSCEEARFFLRSCPGMAEASGEGPSCINAWCRK